VSKVKKLEKIMQKVDSMTLLQASALKAKKINPLRMSTSLLLNQETGTTLRYGQLSLAFLLSASFTLGKMTQPHLHQHI
jgi:hypothetical protein